MAEFGKGFDPRRGHGLPGRSGRPSAVFKEWCRALFEEPLTPDQWPEGRRKLWERALRSDRILLDLVTRAYGVSGLPAEDGSGIITIRYVNDWRHESERKLMESALQPIAGVVDEYPDGRKVTHLVGRLLPDGTKDEERPVTSQADRAPGEGADPASPGRPRPVEEDDPYDGRPGYITR